MPHDPTRWPTPMHAFTFWTREAEVQLGTLYRMQVMYMRAYGHRYSTTDIYIRIRDNWHYRTAAGDWIDAMNQANMYGHAVTHRLIEAQIAELRQVAAQLRRLDRPEDAERIQAEALRPPPPPRPIPGPP